MIVPAAAGVPELHGGFLGAGGLHLCSLPLPAHHVLHQISHCTPPVFHAQLRPYDMLCAAGKCGGQKGTLRQIPTRFPAGLVAFSALHFRGVCEKICGMEDPAQMCPTHVALQVPVHGGLQRAAAIEQELSARVKAAVEQLQRVECLDDEQRAEIQAILEAMQHDSRSHAQLVNNLFGCYQGRSDA
jgi:hypothetical protein